MMPVQQHRLQVVESVAEQAPLQAPVLLEAQRPHLHVEPSPRRCAQVRSPAPRALRASRCAQERLDLPGPGVGRERCANRGVRGDEQAGCAPFLIEALHPTEAQEHVADHAMPAEALLLPYRQPGEVRCCRAGASLAAPDAHVLADADVEGHLALDEVADQARPMNSPSARRACDLPCRHDPGEALQEGLAFLGVRVAGLAEDAPGNAFVDDGDHEHIDTGRAEMHASYGR